MTKPKTVLAEVKKQITLLQKKMKRNKKTLVSQKTINLSLDLSESIKADRVEAIRLKQELIATDNWPFPKGLK